MADTYFEDATHKTALDGDEAIGATSDPGGSPADVYITPDDLADYLDSLTQTLTNKTLTSPIITGLKFDGVAITASDTAPGSPTADDLWWETDSGILWTYGTYASASRWVSVNKYSTGSALLAASGTALVNTAAASGIHTGYDIYFDTLYFKHHVLTTNNGSNYWTMTLRKVATTTVPATGAGTSLGAANTSASTAGNWTEITASINAVIDYSGSGMEFPFYDLTVGAGAPGNVWYSVGVSYRLVHP
jgi:hypothetical protein